MKSSLIAPAALVVLILAAACGAEQPATTETISETVVSSTTAPDTTQTTTAPAPTEQIAEGAQEIGAGLEKAGRGVAQATGEALQQAGQEIQEAARPGEGAAAPGSTAPAQSTAPGVPANGARVYVAKKCDGCHGVNGGGGTAIARKQNIPPLGSPAVKGLSDEELTRILTQGKSSASAAAHKSKNLTPQEIRDLITWIRTL